MLKLKYNFLNMLIAIIISLIPVTSANAFRLFGNPYDLYKTRPQKIREKSTKYLMHMPTAQDLNGNIMENLDTMFVT